MNIKSVLTEGKGGIWPELLRAVYDTCTQQHVHKYEQFLNFCLVGVRLVFVRFKGLVCIFSCFRVSLDHSGFVLLVSFVGCGLYSAPSQQIAWEERVRSDLFCIEWNIKPCSIHLCFQQSLTWVTTQIKQQKSKYLHKVYMFHFFSAPPSASTL